MAQKSAGPILPAEYQQVEWIGGTGTQYINTGVTVSHTNNIKGHYKAYGRISIPTQQISRYEALWGFTNANGFCVAREKNADSIAGYNIPILPDSPHDVLFNLDQSSSYLTVDLQSGSREYVGSISNCWFGIMSYGKQTGSTSLINGRMKVYSFQIVKDDNIIYDGIPCYRKADGVIGMYDLISETFLTNAGTGTFEKGADV